MVFQIVSAALFQTTIGTQQTGHDPKDRRDAVPIVRMEHSVEIRSELHLSQGTPPSVYRSNANGQRDQV